MAGFPSGTQPQPQVLTAGPFVGVRDAVELAAQDANRASAITNGIIRLPELGTDILQRPGFTQRTVQSVTGLPTVGDPNGNFTIAAPTYWLAVMTDGNGANWNLCATKATPGVNWLATGEGELLYDGASIYGTFVRWTPDGETYSYAAGLDGGDSTTYNFDLANRCYFQQFADYLILSDGENRPLKWNPANVGSGTATFSVLTDLSNAIYGPLAVYYGKLFGILASDRTTLVWSEENDPDIGYQASGYDNFWTLRQTSSAPMTALAGTNEALYVFRSNSITSIQGAVNSDFRAAGTLEGVSQSVGTLAPDSVTIAEDSVFFLDQFARPNKIQPGRGLVPLWPNAQRTCLTADLTASVQMNNWGRYIPETEVVVFRVGQIGGGSKLLVYSARTEEFLGEWTLTGYSAPNSAELLFDSTGRSTFSLTKTAASLSFAWQKADKDTDQRDVLDTTASPQVTIDTPRLLADLDVTVLVSGLTVGSQVLNAGQSPLSASWRTSTSGTYPTAVAGVTTAAPDANPSRFSWAPNVNAGRWFQVRITNDTTDVDRAAIGQVRAYATTQRADYTTP